MTGIKRLRELIDAVDSRNTLWSVTTREYDKTHGITSTCSITLRDFLADIADQIEREQDATVADSPYDALPPDERDAIAWVREHGGLGHVKDICHDFRAVVERLGIEWSESELHSLMDAIDRRLMPEGMELPMVDGKPVVIGERLVGYGSGDDGYEVVGVRPTCGWVLVKSYNHITRDGGPVILEWDASKCHRPVPKVLDADGAEIRVGDEVWSTREPKSGTVVYAYPPGDDGQPSVKVGAFWHHASDLTHRAPVLAADGKPLREGETVWGTKGGSYHLTSVHDGKVFARHVGGSFGAEVESAGGEGLYRLRADQLTHERPVADSWERLKEDVGKHCYAYWECETLRCYACPTVVDGKNPRERYGVDDCQDAMQCDLVRRAKALAGGA